MSERTPKPEIQMPEISNKEIELSPEVLEMVMEKVEDIDTPGTAYHVLNALKKWDGEDKPVTETETVENVLRKGILGQTKDGPHQVWFNIIGRTIRISSNIACSIHRGIRNDYWMNKSGKISVAVIFDISEFIDGIGTYETYQQKLEELKKNGSEYPLRDYFHQNFSAGTFFPACPEGPTHPEAWTDDLQQTVSEDDNGHVLLGNIYPQHFRGIVLRFADPHLLSCETIHPEMQEEVKKIVATQLEVYHQKPEMLLPIYDELGNLLWPKQVSHTEIEKE